MQDDTMRFICHFMSNVGVAPLSKSRCRHKEVETSHLLFPVQSYQAPLHVIYYPKKLFALRWKSLQLTAPLGHPYGPYWTRDILRLWEKPLRTSR